MSTKEGSSKQTTKSPSKKGKGKQGKGKDSNNNTGVGDAGGSGNGAATLEELMDLQAKQVEQYVKYSGLVPVRETYISSRISGILGGIPGGSVVGFEFGY